MTMLLLAIYMLLYFNFQPKSFSYHLWTQTSLFLSLLFKWWLFKKIFIVLHTNHSFSLPPLPAIFPNLPPIFSSESKRLSIGSQESLEHSAEAGPRPSQLHRSWVRYHCLASIIIRGIQIKMMLGYHLTNIRKTKIKNVHKGLCWGRLWIKRNTLPLLVGVKSCTASLEISMVISLKIGTQWTQTSKVLFLVNTLFNPSHLRSFAFFPCF